jgi:hypothetical protein
MFMLPLYVFFERFLELKKNTKESSSSVFFIPPGLFCQQLLDHLIAYKLAMEVFLKALHAVANVVLTTYRTWRLLQSIDIREAPFWKTVIKYSALRSISQFHGKFVQSFLLVTPGYGHVLNTWSVRHRHHPFY